MKIHYRTGQRKRKQKATLIRESDCGRYLRVKKRTVEHWIDRKDVC